MRTRRRPLSYAAQRTRYSTTTLLRQLGLEAVGAHHNQNGLCFWCHEPWGHAAEVDHHVPVSRGGTHNIDNLRVLCKICNGLKGSKHPDEFQRFACKDPPAPKAPPTQVEIRRAVVLQSQSGVCYWCGVSLVEPWHLTRRLRGECSSCHTAYRSLTDAQILARIGQELS